MAGKIKNNALDVKSINDKLQFGNLAMLYYPDKAYKTALRLLRREFELTSGLLPALEKVGYQRTSRRLTRRQVMIIFEYLGEP